VVGDQKDRMLLIDVQHALVTFLVGLLMLAARTVLSHEDDEIAGGLMLAGGLMQSRTTGNWLEG